MKIYPVNDKNIELAASIIKSGGLVSFPTETVYGLGADALNPVAVAKIFEAKKRPVFDPLIVHICEISQLERITMGIDDRVMELADKFWPGPLTIVLKKSTIVPDLVTSGLDTIACRIPDHPAALSLIRKSGSPIAAPSANPFGFLSPTSAEHVLNYLGDKIDMILDGGPSPVGIESTIISLEKEPLLLRPGGIPVEDLEVIIGKINVKENMKEKPEAPGQMEYHYSPVTPVIIKENIDFNNSDAGYLLFKHPDREYPKERTEILSEKSDLREAASNFFSSLHRLDKLRLGLIIAESIDESGLGLAIMDRLRKASKKKTKKDS